MLICECTLTDRSIEHTVYAKVNKSKTSDLHKASSLVMIAWVVPCSQNKIPVQRKNLGINISNVCVSEGSSSQPLQNLRHHWRPPLDGRIPLSSDTIQHLAVSHYPLLNNHIPHSINLFVIFRSISRDTVICVSIFTYSVGISITKFWSC